MTEHMLSLAVVPVAGRGTRLAPLTAAVPKPLLPLPDRRGRLRPAIHWVLREALAAAERAAVVCSPGQLGLLRAYLSAAGDEVAQPGRVELLAQERPLGLGHAVSMARPLAGRDRFMVLLGDHIQLAHDGAEPCAVQLARAAASLPGAAAVVGMQPVGESELCRVGVARGEAVGEASSRAAGAAALYRCREIVEKPSVELARGRLVTEGLEPGQYLAHSGTYVFDSRVLDCLDELAARAGRAQQEIELTRAQAMLLERWPEECYLVQVAGSAGDIGTPENYIGTWASAIERLT